MVENLQKGLQLLQKEQGEMEQLLRQLVKIESPSAVKEGVDQVSNCIKEMLLNREEMPFWRRHTKSLRWSS